MSVSYPVPAQTIEHAIEVKKSRFIARAAMVRDRDAVVQFLQRVRQDYPDARHHCWAYLLGNPACASSAAMNDDGEPAGTAGRPILSVIQHKGIGDVMVVVSRWFGGIKLGAGGLTRAYAGATEAVLAQLPLAQQKSLTRCQLQLAFALEQALRHWAAEHEAEMLTVEYGEGVTVLLELPKEELAALQGFCLAHGIRSVPG